MYTYKFSCPNCGEFHRETRNEPYKRRISKKVCVKCRRASEEAKAFREQRQIDSRARMGFIANPGWIPKSEICKACRHWGHSTDEETNEWYKACAKGMISDLSPELGSSLVYAFDNCSSFESKESDG